MLLLWLGHHWVLPGPFLEVGAPLCFAGVCFQVAVVAHVSRDVSAALAAYSRYGGVCAGVVLGAALLAVCES